MSDQPKLPTTEQNDDRYVAICSRVKQIGNELREEIFSAVEKEDFEFAFDNLDELLKLDKIFMLSLKTGMEIVENNRKTQEAAKPKTETPAPAEGATN